MAVLYRNIAFSILVLSTKKRQPVFWKRYLFFRKFVSKLKNWKRSEFPVIFTQKYANLSNGELLWKSLLSFLRRAYVPSADFKIKRLRKSVLTSKTNVKTKTKSNFAVQVAERSNRSFSVYLMKHLYSLILFSLIDWVNIRKRSEACKLLF